MKKQGFTLIELLTVVVILGILSAVAVPKLFGMIAKSKASELGPAARTYEKMQETYIGETHQLGSWSIIGYIGPGSIISTDSTQSSTFGYGGGTLKGGGATVTLSGSSGTATIGWIATSLTGLNDVAVGSSWTIAVGTDNSGNIRYTATIPANAEPLTPTFTQLSR